jgi:hypothetical protein
MLLNLFLFAVIIFLVLAGAQTFRDILKDCRRGNGNRFLSVTSLTIIAAVGQVAAQDAQLETSIYIEIAAVDSVFRDSAKVAIAGDTFQLIKGLDTLSRKIYKADAFGHIYKLSCGDYVKVERDVITGEAWGVYYRDKNNHWFFCEKIKAHSKFLTPSNARYSLLNLAI